MLIHAQKRLLTSFIHERLLRVMRLTRKHKKILLSLCALLLTALYSHLEALQKNEHAFVSRVIDGDTIEIMVAGHSERLRLIGIDTPESRSNHRALEQASRSHSSKESILAMGTCAKQFTSLLLPYGQSVRLETDRRTRDKYGRLLAYIYLPSGEMANEIILSSGYAYPLSIPPNILHEERFKRNFRDSVAKKRGLWSKNPSCKPAMLPNPLTPQ